MACGSREFSREMSQIVKTEDCVCMIPVNKDMMNQVKIWGSGQAEIDIEDELLCFI